MPRPGGPRPHEPHAPAQDGLRIPPAPHRRLRRPPDSGSDASYANIEKQAGTVHV